MRVLADILANRHVLRMGRWLLGLIFIASALGKIVDPSGFADSIAAYRLLPLYAINVVALVLPWVELLVGFGLVNGVAFQSAAMLAAILNVIFLAAVASAMTRGLDIDCGCFTVARSKVGWELIVRDMAFLAISLLVLFTRAADSHKSETRVL